MLKITPKSHPQYFEWSSCLEAPLNELFTIGKADLLVDNQAGPRIAIIGSRIMSPYGAKVIQQIVPGLARLGLTIVSGGAFGVDIESQETALNYTDKIITVLGSGILNPTPRTNIQFFRKVARRGLLVSEFEGDTEAKKFTFIQRNRIISALSDLVLIIEAREKSGALSTADFALQQGKTVACFPGRAFDELSFGTNYLIKQGANLVTSVKDILELLPNFKPVATHSEIEQTLDEVYL